MRNMKVSMKLIVSFLIVIVLALIVGAMGVFGMYRINAADDAMYQGNYLPTVMANEISQNVVEQRVYLRNFVIYDVTEDATTFQNTVNNLEASKKEMEQLFAEYELTIENPEDRAAFQEFTQEYYSEWMPLFDTIHALGAANRTEEAKAALTAASTVAATMDQLSDTLQEVNLADGKATVDNNTSIFYTMTLMEIIALGIAIAVALFFAFYISRLISKPLTTLTAFMHQAGKAGDITLKPEDMENISRFAQAKDEIGQCIGSTAQFVAHLKDVGDILDSLASGDLTAELPLLSNQDTMGLALQKTTQNLNTMFNEIHAATTQVTTGSKQIADGAQALAQGSTEQAATVEELSSSITEIARKTKDNAERAGRASTLADTIKQNAETGAQQMDQMMDAVKEINQASQSISKVIKVIDDIAFQTNILALNAAVEAARAGQHGKGFAVVAEEVRNLAAKSAEAAKDTGELIANSMQKAEFGSRIADDTAKSLNEIVSGINESTELVGEIAQSSEDQSSSIMEINQGIDQVTQVIQQNSATAEESAAASEEMSGQASMLESLIAQFKLKDNFSSGSHGLRASLSSAPPSGSAPSAHSKPVAPTIQKPVESTSHSADIDFTSGFDKY